jgi:pyruvate kinase
MRRAKILATLGPATDTQEKIEQLINAGLNAVRINMSHGTWEEHTETIRKARAAAKKLDKPLAILVDLSGPKIRTGKLKGGTSVFSAHGLEIRYYFARYRRIGGRSFDQLSGIAEISRTGRENFA